MEFGPVRPTFEVLPITDRTALEAARLQESLKTEGVELGFVDAVLVSTADEAGATVATNDGTLRRDAVRERVGVVAYDPGDNE